MYIIIISSIPNYRRCSELPHVFEITSLAMKVCDTVVWGIPGLKPASCGEDYLKHSMKKSDLASITFQVPPVESGTMDLVACIERQ